MDDDKLILDTHELVYRHYLQDGMERIPLEEPIVVRHSSVMGDKEFPSYVVNRMLGMLCDVIKERIDNG